MADSRVATANHSRHIATRRAATSMDAPTFFMKLPPELRNMVYHELWKDTGLLSFKAEVPKTFPEICYDALDEVHPFVHKPYNWVEKRCLPTWLLTDKMLLKEGHAQLVSKSTWNVKRAVYAACEKSLLYGYESLPPNPLLYLSHARYVTIVPVIDLNGMYNRDDQWLRELADSLSNGNRIKSLRVALDMSLSINRADRSRLEGFKILLTECKKLEITLFIRVSWRVKFLPSDDPWVSIGEEVFQDCRNIIGSVFKISPDEFSESEMTDDEKKRFSRDHARGKWETRLLTYTIG